MARRKLESSARAKLIAKKEKRTSNRRIDYSDIPPLSDEQLKSMRRVGRPFTGMAAKQLIAIRLDPLLLAKLRNLADKAGKGYQTLINEVLSQYVEKKSA